MPIGLLKHTEALPLPSDISLPGYKLLETLIEERDVFVLYRGLKEREQRPVLIKLPTSLSLTAELSHRLESEYQLTKDFNPARVVRPIRLERFDRGLAALYEDFGAIPLSRYLGEPMEIGEFLKLAIRIAEALEEIHSHNVIHRDINPRNILINAKTGEAKVGSFGIIGPIAYESREAECPEGTLTYMSPEQTGRMNRPIDYRSDLYSVGMSFYEMLTGTLSFQGKSPLEWVHFHIARVPLSPMSLVPGIPKAVSDIVMKLLSKEAEDRYQSAYGLKSDLEKCLKQWSTQRHIDSFPLGEQDRLDTFQIPRRLYGREKELSLLVQAFDRVVKQGVPTFILVSGSPGIGKSSLIRELYPPITQTWGLFASSKFDQYKREVPYSTLIQAFGGLVQQILTEYEEYVASWRQELQVALGLNAQLIIDAIPEVELIIGPQPPVTKLPITEERNRFNMTFMQFIEVFARREHPLVLFLDDLQWADSASLRLIHHILTRSDARYLLLIGAYRDNEVTRFHPLVPILDQIQRAGTSMDEIVLAPFSLASLNQLIADTLHSDPKETEALARLVLQKTSGNPFFAIQFFSDLYKEGLIDFNRDESRWKWDVNCIQSRGYTDNVVDFIVAKLEKLPEPVRNLLELASCVGNKVPLRTLAWIDEKSEEETVRDLAEPTREGLTVRTRESYQFLHDRVRQAAYSLIPKDRLNHVHLQIGRTLLAHTPAGEIGEKIFDIVNQLNRGASLIINKEEKRRLAELNLVAGRKAKASTAYTPGASYLKQGMSLLQPDHWETQNELARALYSERAQCEFLLGNFDKAEELYSILLSKARTRLEMAELHQVEVDLYTGKAQLSKAVQCGLQGLRLLGIEVPTHPTWDEVLTEYERVWTNLGQRSIEDLANLPTMTDPAMQAALEILSVLFAPAQNTDEKLLLLCSCHMVNLCLRYGNCPASVVAYTCFGVFVGPAFGSYENGYRFGKLGYDLMEKHGFLVYKAKAHLIFGDMILQKAKHLRACLDHAHAAFESAVAIGDLTWGCFARNHLVADLLVLGDPLVEVYEEAERGLEFTRNVNFDVSINALIGMQRLILNMRGMTAHFSTYNDAWFDQEKYEDSMDRSSWKVVTCWYYIWKLQARFLSGDYEEALAAAQKAERSLSFSSTHIQGFEYWYYSALASAALYLEVPEQKKKIYLNTMIIHQEKLEEAAKHCPVNFLNMSSLVSAEIARIKGDDLQATHLYEQAIRSARENGFVQNEAISYEVASRFYRARGFEDIADTYIQKSRSRYAAWGANGKVKQLERQYPKTLSSKPLALEAGVAELEKQLDVSTVVMASQAISSEIELTELLKKLMRIAIENAGAEKGYLILARGDGLWIEAEVEAGQEATRVTPAIAVQSAQVIPQSIVLYVMRTRQRVVLDDASLSNIFSMDPYFASKRPKSVLCLPIMRQNELLGLLYLENNLAAGTFVSERLAILELLASQAAISLRNSLLYSDLKETEHALRNNEEQLRAIVDNTTSLIYLKDPNGLYRLVSRSYQQRLHFTPEQVIGKSDYEIWPKEVADGLRSNDRNAILARAPFECEEEVPQEGGIHTYISVKVPLFDNKGELYGVCGISTDITERKRTEEDRSRMIFQLREALQARDEFLSIASHELRTPLTSLRPHIQMIKQMLQNPRLTGLPESPKFSKMLRIVDHEMDRLARLIHDLLDVSRISSGRLTLNREEVDLSHLVEEVIARFEDRLKFARCPVELHVQRQIRGYLDESGIAQVVENLLSNAIKYGAGTPVEISVSTDGKHAKLVVRDQGIGIAKEDQKRIFDRFERAVPAGRYGGLGLGLYITHQIVYAHGGTIEVESEKGKGSAFIVYLPLFGPSIS